MAEMTWQVLQGDVRQRLADIPERSIHCVVTSPPYYGLRDYGTAKWEGGDEKCKHTVPLGATAEKWKQITNVGSHRMQFNAVCGKCGAVKGEDLQIGLEQTPDEYVNQIVDVFRGVRRVLRDDGTVWLNLGDSYGRIGGSLPPGFKEKDLIGIPWRVAFALQRAGAASPETMDRVGSLIAAITASYENRGEWPDRILQEVERLEREFSDAQRGGWYLRSDIIWAKPNAFPESVTDRPTKAHEYVFLLTKSATYFFDQDAVREPHTSIPPGETPIPYSATTQAQSEREGRPWVKDGIGVANRPSGYYGNLAGRNIRSVWTIVTQPVEDAHFATFPELLVMPCIKAGTSEIGCCPKCGAQWERLPGEKESDTNEPAQDVRREGHIIYTTQDEWICTCEHREDPIPCTVLDPFSGSGTAGIVALKLKRSYIGIELSEEYVEMSRKRLAGTMPLFSAEAPQASRQENLFA